MRTRNFLLLILLSSCMLLSSCIGSKRDYLNRFTELVEKVESADDITSRDYEKIHRCYSQLTGKYYQKYKDQLTGKEKGYLLQLKTRYYVALGKSGVRSVINQIDGFLDGYRD